MRWLNDSVTDGSRARYCPCSSMARASRICFRVGGRLARSAVASSRISRGSRLRSCCCRSRKLIWLATTGRCSHGSRGSSGKARVPPSAYATAWSSNKITAPTGTRRSNFSSVAPPRKAARDTFRSVCNETSRARSRSPMVSVAAARTGSGMVVPADAGNCRSTRPRCQATAMTWASSSSPSAVVRGPRRRGTRDRGRQNMAFLAPGAAAATCSSATARSSPRTQS